MFRGQCWEIQAFQGVIDTGQSGWLWLFVESCVSQLNAGGHLVYVVTLPNAFHRMRGLCVCVTFFFCLLPYIVF